MLLQDFYCADMYKEKKKKRTEGTGTLSLLDPHWDSEGRMVSHHTVFLYKHQSTKTCKVHHIGLYSYIPENSQAWKELPLACCRNLSIQIKMRQCGDFTLSESVGSKNELGRKKFLKEKIEMISSLGFVELTLARCQDLDSVQLPITSNMNPK